MKIKLWGILFLVGLFCFGAKAQQSFDGRSLVGIKSDYRSVGMVVRVKITKITVAASDINELYKVESETLETFKGKAKKGEPLTFYFGAEKGYAAQQLVGKEWVVFLETERPVPAGGKGWYELENSTIPASEKLSIQLRKLKGAGKR